MATFTGVMRLSDQMTQTMNHQGTGELVADPQMGEWTTVTVVFLEPVQTVGQIWPRAS